MGVRVLTHGRTLCHLCRCHRRAGRRLRSHAPPNRWPGMYVVDVRPHQIARAQAAEFSVMSSPVAAE